LAFTKKKLSTNEFQSIIHDEWNDIKNSLFVTLAKSISKRIDEVIEKNGHKINY